MTTPDIPIEQWQWLEGYAKVTESVGGTVTAGKLREAAAALRVQKERIGELERVLDQLLDDMGSDGHCVCEEAKQQAIEVLASSTGGNHE